MAASIVPAHKQASAVATMFMGLTIANIGGVPLATWVGQTLDGVCLSLRFPCSASLLCSLCGKHYRKVWLLKTNVKAELKVLTRTPVVLALLTTVLGAGAMFTLYTYMRQV